MRHRLTTTMGYGLATGVALLFLLPLVWMVVASLRQPGLPPPRGLEWWPTPIAWGNYPRLFTLLPFATYIGNSLIVTGLGVMLTLLTASWAGFAIAQLPERTRRVLVILSVGLLFTPLTALWLPRLVLYKTLGWLDTYAPLLAPALMGTNPLFVLLFYWSARRLPRELIEAARLEGAGVLAVWGRIVWPLSSSIALAVGALAFIAYWGDFLSPLLYLKSQALYTLPVGVQQLFQLDKTNWPLLLAGSVVMTLPPVGLFWVAQRFLLRQDA